MSLMIFAGAALAYVGLAANSFGMSRHHADIMGRGREPSARTRLRCLSLGWLGIALSLAACVAASGWHLGPVLWCGVLTLSALVLTLLLQYAPLRALQGALLACAAALLFGAAALA